MTMTSSNTTSNTSSRTIGHYQGLTELEADTIQIFDKPEVGTWTRSFGLDFEPVDASDNYDPEFYELEKQAIFKRSWLHVGRVEELPRKGSYFTRELDGLGYSVIIVRGTDDKIRAFHNVCSHRGNQLVWEEHPSAEQHGTCRQFTCKYHGWRYFLDGEIAYVHNAAEFEGLDPDQLKLPEIHCDVWAGFVFVNFAENPEGLRDSMGPELVKLEAYPFHKLTEKHRLEAVVNSNWKLFIDAFAEFYHVPYVHAKLNNPQGDPGGDKPPFMLPYFKRMGKHRMLSSGGQFANLKGRGALPAQEVFKATIHGPFTPPDLGPLGELSNPGHLAGWGMDMWHIHPNFVIITWSRNTYVTYTYWPTGPDSHTCT
jgi:nitrite reductase/ring-hydroxylating ferredoxin subunit